MRDYGAKVALYEVWVFLNGLRKRRKDYALLSQLVLERGGDGDAVEHGVDRDARERLLLLQGYPQLRVGLEQLRVDLIEAFRPVLVGLGC